MPAVVLDRVSKTYGGKVRAVQDGETDRALIDRQVAEIAHALDVGLRTGLRAEIAALVRSMGLTTIYVTHDQSEALSMADRVVMLRDGTVEDIGPPGRVYGEPATAFAGGFTGAPPINLVWATIWLDNGKRVTVDFGPQQLTLPWAEPRAGVLTMFHGRPVIVGVRPETLSPSGGRPSRYRLHGRITGLEYYGHEWLARLDTGLHPADLDEIRRRVAPAGDRAPSYLDEARQRTIPAAAQVPSYLGEHRGTSLLVRLGAPGSWAAGQEASVDVDLSRLQIFDAQGRRIEAASSWAAAPVTGS